MSNLNPYERESLEYLLRTRTEPAEVHRSANLKTYASYAFGALCILAAIVNMQPFGPGRFIWIAASAFGGILIAYGAVHKPLTRQYEAFHEFIDFDRLQARLEDT